MTNGSSTPTMMIIMVVINIVPTRYQFVVFWATTNLMWLREQWLAMFISWGFDATHP